MHPSEYQRLFENEESHWWFRARRDIARAMLDQYLPSAKRRRILDAGCGTGGNLALLARYGEVTGVDISPIALSLAQWRREGGGESSSSAHLARASLPALPFPDEHFDLVTAFDVLYHLWIRDDVAAMAELRRVLKPGGVFLMTDSAWRRLQSAHDEINLARERYDAPSLRARLHRAGFEPLRVSYANFLLLPVVLAVRTAQRLRPGDAPEGASDVRPVWEPLNALLYTIYRGEATFLPYVDLPRGSSIVAVARRR